MSDFGDMLHPVARKRHRCEWCYGPIPVGEKHCHYKGMWEGDWQDWRMHDECLEGYDAADLYYEGFTSGEGEMPERVKAIFREHCSKLLSQVDGIIKERASAQGQQMATA